jgi:hypothetical protein
MLFLFCNAQSLPSALADQLPIKTTGAAHCAEPFCTYAPPQLTGNGMASAVRAVIRAASRTTEHFHEPRSRPKLTLSAFADDGPDFHFISPFLVATTVDDPKLLPILGRDCISKLATVHYTRTPTDIATGPVYLYHIRSTSDSPTQYLAALVYGFAPENTVGKHSLNDRVANDHSGGRFSIFTPSHNCEAFYTLPFYGREEKQHAAAFYPNFFGVGYYKKDILVYSLESISSKTQTRPYYRFEWHLGLEAPSNPSHTVSAGSISNGAYSLPEFSSTFDPFAIVNQQERLP